MNRIILILFAMAIVACSDLSKVEDRVNLEWNYNYSSDVIHAVLINHDISETNSGHCKVRYSTFKVIESFKGNLKTGDIFKASGIGAHNITNEGSE